MFSLLKCKNGFDFAMCQLEKKIKTLSWNYYAVDSEFLARALFYCEVPRKLNPCNMGNNSAIYERFVLGSSFCSKVLEYFLVFFNNCC